MSTDNDIDNLLRDAGARWRDANPGGASHVDFDAITPATQPRERRNWLLIASAALIVAALAVGSAWFVSSRGHSGNAKPAGPVTPANTRGLVGTHWVLLMAGGPNENSGPVGESLAIYPPIEFNADGTVLASDGCNSISGPATIDASTIKFGALATSAMGCTLDPGDTYQEHVIQTVLQGTVSWTITDTGLTPGSARLTITKPGAGTLVYEGKPAPQPVTDPTKMPGAWRLIELDATSGSSQTSRSADYGELLVVTPDGTFKVQNRCYANAGKVDVGTGTAAWTAVHLAGSIPCPATQTQQDEQDTNNTVNKVLDGSTTWSISVSGDLIITKGGNTIVYAPFASEQPTTSESSTN